MSLKTHPKAGLELELTDAEMADAVDPPKVTLGCGKDDDGQPYVAFGFSRPTVLWALGIEEAEEIAAAVTLMCLEMKGSKPS